MVKYSILMTVHNRPTATLLATFHALAQCDLSDCEVIVVNDGSVMPYGWVRDYLAETFKHGGWYDIEPYEAFRLKDGFNNPARAFNFAASRAQGDRLFLMSSDVLVPPRTWRRARSVDLASTLWTPFVEDTRQEPPLFGAYCGPNRLFPMPWLLGCSRQALLAVRGWDERYLDGLCYEDNDVVGRLALQVGRFTGDWSVKVYHQGHEQPAYDLADDLVLAANTRNRDWTREKWGGIPFDSEHTPFNVTRKMHPSGLPTYECVDKLGCLAQVVAATTGLLA